MIVNYLFMENMCFQTNLCVLLTELIKEMMQMHYRFMCINLSDLNLPLNYFSPSRYSNKPYSPHLTVALHSQQMILLLEELEERNRGKRAVKLWNWTVSLLGFLYQRCFCSCIQAAMSNNLYLCKWCGELCSTDKNSFVVTCE